MLYVTADDSGSICDLMEYPRKIRLVPSVRAGNPEDNLFNRMSTLQCFILCMLFMIILVFYQNTALCLFFVNILHSSQYRAAVWVCAGNNVDNTGMF